MGEAKSSSSEKRDARSAESEASQRTRCDCGLRWRRISRSASPMQALPLMEVEAITDASIIREDSSSGSTSDKSNRVTTISPRVGVGTLMAPFARAH